MDIVRDWFQRHLSNPQVVVLVAVLATAVVLVVTLGHVFVPVLVSLVMAYLLDGLVRVLEQARFHRLPAVFLVYTLFVAVVVIVLVFGMPIVVKQVNALPANIGKVVDDLETAIVELSEEHPERFGDMAVQLQETVTGIETRFGEWLTEQGQNLFAWIQNLLTILIYVILVPTLVFFMLKDKHSIQEWFRGFVPQESALTERVWRDVDRQIGNYLRGKFWEILIVGGVSYVVFASFDLDFSLLLAVAVGISVIVPYVGATLVTIPVAIVAYAQWGWTSDFAWLLLAYFVIQVLDGNVLVPLLFSEVVNLHPIAIITAILFFGYFGGVWGAFFAIPLATLVKAVINAWPRDVREDEDSGAAREAA